MHALYCKRNVEAIKLSWMMLSQLTMAVPIKSAILFNHILKGICAVDI